MRSLAVYRVRRVPDLRLEVPNQCRSLSWLVYSSQQESNEGRHIHNRFILRPCNAIHLDNIFQDEPGH